MSASTDQILAAVLGLKQDMGRIEARVENVGEHTVGVSRKTDALRADFEQHKADMAAAFADVRAGGHAPPCAPLRAHEGALSAHGARAWAYVCGIITAGLGAVFIVAKLYQALNGRP